MKQSAAAVVFQVGLILVATAVFQGARPAQAQEPVVKTWTMDVEARQWEVHPATPTYEGTTGLFHLPTAYTLPRNKVSFSVFGDNLDRNPKDLDITMVGASLGYGIIPQLELFGNFVGWTGIDADALYMAGRVNDFPYVNRRWEHGVGDASVGLKLKILDDYARATDPVGLAIRGTVKIPTADEKKGLGTGKPSFRGDLILSKNLNNAADIHFMVGYQVNSDPKTPVALDLADEIKYGVGLNVPVFSWIQLQAEVIATSYKGGDRGLIAGATNNPDLGNVVQVDFDPQTDAFGVGNQRDPVDIVVGPVLFVKPGFFIRPAFSMNANWDKRGLPNQNHIGAQLSIGFHPGFGGREIGAAAGAAVITPNRAPTVTCSSDRPQIMPGETVGVHATASDPEGDPLTYAWSTTSGNMTGAGANASLDYTGVTAPAPATVTVRVSDNHGNTTPCSVTLTPAATQRPEAVSCVSGGFPRNLSRLTNVDKACLDDVAQRLKADPRATVTVVGHADSHEAAPDQIGQQRADAVKNYLVQERGIDAARITTRSAADTKLLDTGADVTAQARNRRVEVWFVPEGATAPQ